MLADDVHAEVEYQVLDTLAQQIAITVHLKATAQLVAVDAQAGCQLTYLRVRVLHKIEVGLETCITRMLYSLLKDAVEQRITELKTVGTQVIVNILRHVQVDELAIVRLDALVDDFVAMTDDVLNQQTLHLGGLLLRRMQTYGNYQFLAPRTLFPAICALLLLLLFLFALDIGVDRGHQRLFVDIEAV